MPSFAGTSAYQVRLMLEGMVDNPAFGEARLSAFSTYDFLALDYLHRDKPLPDALKERLPSLLEAGAVELMGRGKGRRYMLSHALYAAIGAKGTYTRVRGLDHETNKSLLEQHLRHQGEQGAPISELHQVLPMLSERTVHRMLKELQEQGRIRLHGERRWARWYISSGKDRN